MANHLVQKFTADGKLLMTLGTKNKPGRDDRHFNQPADANVGPDGTVFVADGYGNSRIAKFAGDGKFLKAWGKKGRKDGQFYIPHGVFWDQGKLYVADRENGRLQIFDADGKHEATWKNTGYPYGLYPRRGGLTYLADGEKGDLRSLHKHC